MQQQTMKIIYGCTRDDNAIVNGHIETVEWLYNNKKECCKSDSDFVLLAIEQNITIVLVHYY